MNWKIFLDSQAHPSSGQLRNSAQPITHLFVAISAGDAHTGDKTD
jgi:hypothetical protein